jgi:hypothetical protein
LMFEEDLGQQYKYTLKAKKLLSWLKLKWKIVPIRILKLKSMLTQQKKMYSLYELDKKTLLIYTCLHPIIWRLKIMMRLLWTTNYYAK